ncbi:telomere repeat-binding factor 1 [Phtheirospermum japonicum]|uniref:MYB transcription factor n=1 Tax=Phtheirospermum japonicum TaxID=374723 RepID=A0A830CI58_9LAMI|nr:telomere repeat-binding factor 1 [Phtheirospermum japonicum]
MGAPKQKWNSEEEAALKSGVLKHGVGKWRTILKDPQFSRVLYLRSNVDLKDKWRNMSVLTNGWSTRERARFAFSRVYPATRLGESSLDRSSMSQSDEDIVGARPSGASSPSNGTKGSIMRLDNLIMEAIHSLREPGGSSKTTIAAYIEDQYWAPPNFRRILSGKLKHMSAMGKLFKVKRRFSIAPPSTLSTIARRRISPGIRRDDFDFFDNEVIDLELASISSMTPDEAAAHAAQAVLEAEEAMAAAEEACFMLDGVWCKN